MPCVIELVNDFKAWAKKDGIALSNCIPWRTDLALDAGVKHDNIIGSQKAGTPCNKLGLYGSVVQF
jgi:hypothetical protein